LRVLEEAYMIYSKIIGLGSYVPSQIVKNR